MKIEKLKIENEKVDLEFLNSDDILTKCKKNFVYIDLENGGNYKEIYNIKTNDENPKNVVVTLKVATYYKDEILLQQDDQGNYKFIFPLNDIEIQNALKYINKFSDGIFHLRRCSDSGIGSNIYIRHNNDNELDITDYLSW